MTVVAHENSRCSSSGFRHQALLYAGDKGFLDGTLRFIRAGVEAGEPILVVVGEHKIRLLRETLGDGAGSVLFADMAMVGANPARIIPAWHSFVDEQGASVPRMRGIGEPISPTRGPAELVECQHHEALLNLAFAHSGPFVLLCPYDTEALGEHVIDEARRSHPYLVSRQAVT